MRWVLSIIWAIFSVLFLVLGHAHWTDAKAETPPFELTKRPGKDYGSIQILGADIDQPIKDFAADFNEYLKTQNESANAANRRAAYGYFLAAATAAISMFLELGMAIRQRKTNAD